ncbi:MAG: hypothetical protein ACRC1R_00355 [Cetobacterium sp.]|uniref:hypothetical protein n=1 Tax=Cetobacterium sp. TaxID=2071632 RepID=UPI003F341DD1
MKNKINWIKISLQVLVALILIILFISLGLEHLIFRNEYLSVIDNNDWGNIIVTLIGSFLSLSVAVVAVWISNKNINLMKKGGGTPLLIPIDRAYQITVLNNESPLIENNNLKKDKNHNLSLYNVGLGVALNVHTELFLDDKNNVLSDLGINLDEKIPLKITLNSKKYNYLPLYSYRFALPTRDSLKEEIKFKIEWQYMFDVYIKAWNHIQKEIPFSTDKTFLELEETRWKYMQKYSVIKLKISYQDIDDEKYEDIYSIKFTGDMDCFNINFIKEQF